MTTAPHGLYDDVALKPKLLRSLLREYVPDDRHPFTNHSELSYVVSTVKAHNLLAEWAPQSLEGDSTEAWKSAVDSWVHRLLTLASGNLQDKCWAGICLLGVTCQECSPQRFLTSYAVWFDKLLTHIKSPAVSPLAKAASCASLSDMFTRLSVFPNARRDGTSQATKIIEPVLRLLNEDNSDFILEEAVNLLCTLINFFPFSVQRHYDSVEAAIVSRLMSGKCCADLKKKLVRGLSLLPKSRGDEASWSVLMEKILLCMNSQLNDAFQGIEEEVRSSEVARALFFSGKEHPSPLGGLAASELALHSSIRRPEQVLGSRISALMQCCCEMLTVSYPAMVSVSVSALIALAGRVLMIDDLLLSSSFSFMTIFKQEFICSEIPFLQSQSLDILAALVKGLSSQMLPHASAIIRILNEYLSRCKFPNLRIKTYGVVKALLMSMGVGIATYISMDVVNNVICDLSDEKNNEISSMHPKIQVEPLKDSHRKKRKHSTATQSYQEQPSNDGLEADVRQSMTPITLKISALETLEVLLTVGCLMRSQTWRRKVDSLLISVADNACKGPWSKDKNLCDDPENYVEFKLAALRALHASLLSPSQTRPSHLAQGLELFRRGLLESGTKIADYCGHALRNLEVLIHPRSLPVFDLESSPHSHALYSSGSKQFPTFNAIGSDDPESAEDDLNLNWPGDDDEMETEGDSALPARESPAITTAVAKSPEDEGGFNNENPGKKRHTITAEESPSKFEINHADATIHETEAEHHVQESVDIEPMRERYVSEEDEAKDGLNYSAAIDGTSKQEMETATLKPNRGYLSDYESDDSLPDIVDGDPDSD